MKERVRRKRAPFALLVALYLLALGFAALESRRSQEKGMAMTKEGPALGVKE